MADRRDMVRVASNDRHGGTKLVNAGDYRPEKHGPSKGEVHQGNTEARNRSTHDHDNRTE